MEQRTHLLYGKAKRKHKAINFKNYKLMKIRYFSIS
nr:MAG TPA: hypothetical protein [Caudoviricetes sp.]